MRKNLEVHELGDLLDQAILAILATRHKDDTTLLSPVWFEWLDGGFSIVIGASDIKAKHLARDPRVTVLVAEQSAPYRSIEVRAEAELTSPPDILSNFRRVAIRYLGEEAGIEYAQSFEGVALTQLRIVPGDIRTWDFKDEVN